MSRIVDSLASICFFRVALPVAFVCTVEALVRNLFESLRNIWR